MSDVIKQMYDEDGNRAFPITHVSAVKDSNGTTLPDILDRDYPTTSKTPVEGSTEVSLVTRGEKYDYDKVNNATDVTGASDIANLKYVLFNGTNEQFKTALDSYVNERIRSSFGALLHNLDKSGTASGNIDVACVAKTPASGNTPESYDFGSMSAANLASLLGAYLVKQMVYVNTLNDDTAASYLMSVNAPMGISFRQDSEWGAIYMFLKINDNNGTIIKLQNYERTPYLYIKRIYEQSDSGWKKIEFTSV